MRFRRAVAAELRKAATLPSTVVGAAVAVLGCLGVSLLNAVGVRQAVEAGEPQLVAWTSAAEAAFSALPLGAVGAVVIGVVTMSSEYTPNSPDAGGGRQVAATLAAAPGRLLLVPAKAVCVALLVAMTTATAVGSALAAAYAVLGGAGSDPADVAARASGAILYCVLTALLALAVTVLTRSGLLPLIVLVVNSSLVSVSFLLSRLTPLARYLPDVAGVGLFARDTAIDDPLGAVPGGVVMAAWALAALGLSAVWFARRDA